MQRAASLGRVFLIAATVMAGAGGCAYFPVRGAAGARGSSASQGSPALARVSVPQAVPVPSYRPTVKQVYSRGTSDIKVSVDDPNFLETLDEQLSKVRHERVTLSTEALKALVRSEKGRRLLIRDLSGQLEALKNVDVQEAANTTAQTQRLAGPPTNPAAAASTPAGPPAQSAQTVPQ